MDRGNFTARLWPIHLKPKPDELLTSWLTRLSIRHGLSMFGFFSTAVSNIKPLSKQAWNTDLDKFVAPSLLKELADKTATPIADVFATTLAAYQGVLVEKHNRRGNSMWILPIKVSSGSEMRHGLQFCPFCLAEDKEPYYRRNWRLACTVLCTTHKVPLLDRCAECNSPVAFHKRLTGITCDLSSFSMTSCQSCEADLRDATSYSSRLTPHISEDEVAFQEVLVNVISKGWIEISGQGPVYSHLYFIVLRHLMQMLSRLQRTNRFRNQVNTRYGTENFTVTYTSKSPCIELLNVTTRRCLLTMARELMRGWPDEFIDFCQTYRLTSHILLKRLSPAPFWYWNVVHDQFTRTIYEYNDEEVKSALRCMEKMKEQLEGRRPFRYDEKMKAVSEFLIRARDSKYYNSNKWPNMQRKANWRNSGWTSKYEDSNIEPAPIHLIPDALWIKIKKLLPLSLYASGKDRNLSDDRKVVNGILYILCTDTPWHKTPAEFGSHTTIYRKYVRWKNSGVLTQILALCSNIYS